MVVSNIFGIFIPNLGEDAHFDEHIFQMGWFNHQPARGDLQILYRFLQQFSKFPDPKWATKKTLLLSIILVG